MKSLIVERDVETPMRDGVILRADVYRPQTDTALPVLLQRTPYLKGFSQLTFALTAAERGYAVVIQDTHGCGSSGGEGYPFINEKEDGNDSVQWAAVMLLPDEILLRWFDYWLKDVQNGVMQEPPLQIFVMEDNQWRLSRAHDTPYYLHSSGAANTLNGNGRLAPDLPGGEPVDSFVYGPRNPVRTHSGSLCCSPSALPASAYDQREIEARPDVLVFTSSPLERDLEVTGPVEALFGPPVLPQVLISLPSWWMSPPAVSPAIYATASSGRAIAAQEGSPV